MGYRPLLSATGWGAAGPAASAPVSMSLTPSPTPSPSSASASPGPDAVGAGLIDFPPAATPGPVPGKVPLAARINGAAVKGIGTTSGYVVDATTGQVLHASRATTPLIPASTMKVLTSLAVLDSVEPGTTFDTRVVTAAPGQIILVGGGDPYLTAKPDTSYPRAQSATRLAALTAAALKASGTTRVSLGYDDTLFTGPDWHPTWPTRYFGNVVPIHALSLDGGRDAKGALSRTPHAAAATTFSALLTAQGITVTGKPGARKAPAGATELARVSSLPVEILVQEALVHSDNVATEMLLRHLALADHQPPSFVGGHAALVERLTALKVWHPLATVVDGSGLSRSNLVPATMLGSAIRVATTTPRLSGLLEGLPVAGVSGTLSSRYFDDTALPGRGRVHAKTGTLTKVSTLAGYTTTKDGRVLVFAFMSNNATNEWGVRVWLDKVTGALTSCGC
ncbi:MAG TPA: D-alanyl-D-alanine carboxypeptidase/D-alanyl-D-alanine-endopeptidase [Propionibacteriaceae bacterium]|nr:D-alanyl-D-alanine carboxypeptidase/D-alanyl-D-alanine-endopeptidase [Propionibacteriaceae bacterium]